VAADHGLLAPARMTDLPVVEMQGVSSTDFAGVAAADPQNVHAEPFVS
jgi:hypothetical protein